jgi:hypothetical protein
VKVSIIVAGRNSAKWIREAVSSALTQTIPCEVIYSDDCSTDGTLDALAGIATDKLTVIRSPTHKGVCAARNRGAAASKGEYLCSLDTDDVMPPDFIEKHLDAMQPGMPFVYGPALAFGAFERLWPAASFESWDRWSYNTVNTSALYSRSVFSRAGGWKDAPTMWDHCLALRAIRFGTTPPAVSQAILNYRQHESSWSSRLAEKTTDLVEVRELIRRRNARLTVSTIFSGRVAAMFPAWIQDVAYAVRFAELAHKPDLVIAVDPKAADSLPAARSAAQVYQEAFSSIRFVSLAPLPPWSDEHDRRNKVATWLAQACDQIRKQSQGDVLWSIEDDIVVPITACRDLWNAVTSGVRPPDVVSAVYRSRHCPELLIAGRITMQDGQLTYPEARDLPAGTEPVPMDFVGMGCTMLWLTRPQIPNVWPSHVRGTVPAHDWAMSIQIKEAGGNVLWHPSVRCGHATSATDILWP